MLSKKYIVSAMGLGLLFSGLQALTLRDVLGESIDQMNTGITKLDLSHKGITKITSKEAQLLVDNYPNLRELRLYDNDLHEISGTMLGGLTGLEVLVLGGNKLAEVPHEIGQLKDLKTLDLSYNNLSSLPDSIGQLVSLEVLVLANNKLSSIPESFSNLSNLKKLWLNNNELKSIPEFIPGNMKELEYLDVGGNRLKLRNNQRLFDYGIKTVHVS